MRVLPTTSGKDYGAGGCQRSGAALRSAAYGCRFCALRLAGVDVWP